MTKLLFLLIALPTLSSQAQFNDSTHHHFRYAATGIINRTNDTRSYMLNNAVGFGINRKKFTFNTNAQWIYGKQDTILTNNDVNAGVNYDLYKETRKLYYWGLGNFTSSYSLNINYQFQAGVGLGYNIVNKPDLEIVVSDGIIYEISDLDDPIIGRDKYQTFRNSLRIKHRWQIKELIVWEGMHFWQPSLSSFDDYIIRLSTSMSIKLRKWLSITSAVIYNRISRTDRENFLFNFGLSTELYF